MIFVVQAENKYLINLTKNPKTIFVYVRLDNAVADYCGKILCYFTVTSGTYCIWEECVVLNLLCYKWLILI